MTRDVSRRRGEILDTCMDTGRCMLKAYVPLRKLFGYTTELVNFSQRHRELHHGAEDHTRR